MVYFVGENNGSTHHSPVLAASGVGLDVAQGWEKAIRQALMPVTPQASVCTAAGQGKDHSKQADKALYAEAADGSDSFWKSAHVWR